MSQTSTIFQHASCETEPWFLKRATASFGPASQSGHTTPWMRMLVMVRRCSLSSPHHLLRTSNRNVLVPSVCKSAQTGMSVSLALPRRHSRAYSIRFTFRCRQFGGRHITFARIDCIDTRVHDVFLVALRFRARLGRWFRWWLFAGQPNGVDTRILERKVCIPGADWTCIGNVTTWTGQSQRPRRDGCQHRHTTCDAVPFVPT